MNALTNKILTTLIIVGSVGSASFAVETRPILTLKMAEVMADACEALQKKNKWKPVNIAIFDDAGNMKLFRRQNDSYRASIEIAQLKARTSAMLPRSTRDLGKVAYNGKKPHGLQHVPGLVVFPGGLPVFAKNGHQIGGIGVSGETSDNDEKCAQAGIAALAKSRLAE